MDPTKASSSTILQTEIGRKMTEDNSLIKETMKNDLETPQRTVLRLKRRIEDSPSQVLVMSYKRRKEDPELKLSDCSAAAAIFESDEICSRVFCLAGTVTANKVDNSVAETIKKALSEVSQAKSKILSKSIPEPLKKRVTRLNEKANEGARQKSIENRFRVISNKRGLENIKGNFPSFETSAAESDNETLLQLESERLFNLLDLVADEDKPSTAKRQRVGADYREPGSVTVNGLQMVKEITATKADQNLESSTFVFDLYVSSNGVVEDQIQDQIVSVRKADEEFDFDWHRGDENFDKGSDADDDEEDSNDENNWKNDYPDTDSENDTVDTGGFRGYYEEDGDFLERVRNVRLNDHELSSDEDADCIYSIENDGADDGLGGNYIRYKARLLREQEFADEVVSSPSESEID